MQFNHLFAFLFLSFILLLACDAAKEETLVSIYTDADIQVERMEEVEILYSDSAQVRVRITAPRMLRYLERNEARQEFTNGIFVEFFDNFGRVTGSLRADSGIRYEKSQEVVVHDNVVWKNQAGDELETDELSWNEQKGKVTTNRPVTIIRANEIIHGIGFEAEQDFSSANIRAVQGRVKIDEAL